MSSVQLHDFDADQLAAFREKITDEFNDLKAKNLKLDLTRGKPSSEQLDFADDLLALPGKGDYKAADGTDVRNYGGLTGIQDIRQVWAELMGVPVEQVLAGDSSSLNIMFDVISWSYAFGNNDSERPWKDEETVKWICPVPGYDRHFSISERFGFEMITVPMNEDGPDVAAVAELVKDPQVKGMWVVPTFSNPTGYSVSEGVAKQLAELETAAPDFRIVWDNAYAVHTLTEEFPEILDIVGIAEAAGNPNRIWAFTSTSKITLAGSGVSFFITSEANRNWYTDIAGIRGIGPNKVNQLAHARYFGDAEGVRAVMRKHAASLAPKFETVLNILETRLGEYGVATWTHPTGGYFISLDVVDGTASRVVELAKEAGIALTGAGSSFPLRRDPNNRNIRLAPSLPPVEELEVAMDGVATCVLLAAAEHYAR